MAKLSGKGAVIALDDSGGVLRTISTDIKTYTIEFKYPGQDVTGFTEPQNFIPGALVTSVTLTPFWNTASTTGATTVIRGILNSATSKTLEITPEGTGLKFSGEFMCEGIDLSADAAGKPLEMGSVKFVPMGSVAASWA